MGVLEGMNGYQGVDRVVVRPSEERQKRSKIEGGGGDEKGDSLGATYN